jgi:chromosome segregation ATPase
MDFQDWVYRSSQVTVRANDALQVYAGPEVSAAEFRTLCAEAARKGRDDEIEKVGGQYDKKIVALQVKLERETRELSEDETELSQRKMEELGTHAENVFGLFSKRSRSTRRLSSSLGKRRMTEQAKADVEESLDAIADMKKQVAVLEKEKERELEVINDHWGEIANQSTDIPVTPYKKDVMIDVFGVAWMPYHVVRVDDQTVELPGYGSV